MYKSFLNPFHIVRKTKPADPANVELNFRDNFCKYLVVKEWCAVYSNKSDVEINTLMHIDRCDSVIFRFRNVMQM